MRPCSPADMLSSAGENRQLRARLQFSSQSSQQTPSQTLNSAFRGCNIADSQDQNLPDVDFSYSQSQQLPTQPESRLTQVMQSQAMNLGSQDFLTPKDQEFDTEPTIGGKKMRSPLKLTPPGKKRQRSNLATGSQAPPLFTQNLQQLARDARYSPQTTHNVFGQQSEAEGVNIGRRLPIVAMYREIFKELRTLGQGHFSKVFHVRNRVDGLEYAIKRSKQEVCDEGLKRQWFQEIQALAAAGCHQNVVQYYFSWLEEERNGVHFYIQMGKCGSSLGQRFSVDKTPLKEAELIDIMKQMASSLRHLHDKGIAHMDVKPDNIYESEEGIYKLGDFGLATSLNCRPSASVEEGDCKYLPAEILNGNYSRLDKADMFSLGLTLYQLATGLEPPESGEQYCSLRQGKLKLLPGYSTSFTTLLSKLMSRDPTERPSPLKLLADKLFTRQPPAYQQLQLRLSGS